MKLNEITENRNKVVNSISENLELLNNQIITLNNLNDELIKTSLSTNELKKAHLEQLNQIYDLTMSTMNNDLILDFIHEKVKELIND